MQFRFGNRTEPRRASSTMTNYPPKESWLGSHESVLNFSACHVFGDAEATYRLFRFGVQYWVERSKLIGPVK